MANSGKIIIKRFARKIKRLYYQSLGFIGDCVFFLFRTLRLIPKISPFSDKAIKRILIIRMDRIGDVVLSTPTFRAIRRHFAQAEIFLLLRSYTKDLLAGNPNIDKLIVFDDKRQFFSEVKNKAGELKKKGFDLAIVLHPNFWANFLSFASRAKYRLGYDSAGSGFFLTTRIKDSRRENPRHEVEVNLDVVRSIGVEASGKVLELYESVDAQNFADEFLKDNALNCSDVLVAIHPGGFYPYTHWLPQGFAAVADSLIDKFKAKIIIVGFADETGLAKEVTDNMRHAAILAAGKLNLSQLVSIIKRCNLFIGNSSGPMHIACALKVPVVAIFGNVHPVDNYKSWGPWGENTAVVSKNLGCLNCQPSDCPSLDCMKLITAEEVLAAASGLLIKN